MGADPVGGDPNVTPDDRDPRFRGTRVFITNVKGTFFGMSESEEASKRR